MTRFDAENELLPEVLLAQDVSFTVIPATLALAVLATFRFARRSQTDADGWRHLGATRSVVVAALGLPVVIAVLAGLAGAVVVGWCASGIGPVASARTVQPENHLGLPASVVVAVTAASMLVLFAGVLASALIAARRTMTPGASRPSRIGTLASRISHVPMALGVRSAIGSTGDLALVAGAIAAVAAVVASVIFSTNLSTLVAQPDRFGWPYDAAVVVGFGYGGADRERVAEALDRPEVERWGVAALGNATIEDVTVPIVASRSGFADLPLPLVEGALPTGRDELVLGTGALLSSGLLDTIVSAAEETAGVPAGTFADGSESFVVIDLRDGVDAAAFLASIDDDLGQWSLDGYFPFLHADPVRPAQIADGAAMRSAPVWLAVFISAAMGVGLALAVGLAARNRRRELAVLRTLRATSAQLGATVHWQALTVVGVGLVVGTPVGLLLGTITWRGFAGGLGIADALIVPTLWIGTVVVGAIVLALLASAGPSRYASRVAPSTVLREQ
ncbi:MAG: FtsX-like permease family protein [Acidimicrobiales bacterium]